MTVPRAPALLRTPKHCCMLAKTVASGKLCCSDACLGGGSVWAVRVDWHKGREADIRCAMHNGSEEITTAFSNI